MQITTAVVKDDAGTEQSLLEMASLPLIMQVSNTACQGSKHTEFKRIKRVKINVPDGLIVVEYPKPNIHDRPGSKLSPENIEELNDDNTYGSYRPKSGTITYSLRDTAEYSSSISFGTGYHTLE